MVGSRGEAGHAAAAGGGWDQDATGGHEGSDGSGQTGSHIGVWGRLYVLRWLCALKVSRELLAVGISIKSELVKS